MAYTALAQQDHRASGDEVEVEVEAQDHATPSMSGPSFIHRRPISGYALVQANADAFLREDSVSLKSVKSAMSATASCKLLQDDEGASHGGGSDIEGGHGLSKAIIIPTSASPEPMIRSVSSVSSANLRHPAPGLESLQGAYVGNVERLERSAERLSMTSSDIGEQLRMLRWEQQRRESCEQREHRDGRDGRESRGGRGSRASSAVHSPHDQFSPVPAPRRTFSSTSVSNSIIGVNNAARNGGYSPTAYLSSPRGSIRSPSNSHLHRTRSTSRPTSRIASAPDSHLHGVPHSVSDSFSPDFSPPVIPAAFPDYTSNSAYIPSSRYPQPRPAPMDPERSPPLGTSSSRYLPQENPPFEEGQVGTEEAHHGQHRSPDLSEHAPAPSPPALSQAKNQFSDFDGVHYVPYARPLSQHSSSNRLSMVEPPPPARRPISMMEPGPGMVYYPAPVPRMLNLPKRLSKLPTFPSPQDKSHIGGPDPAQSAARRSTANIARLQDDHEAEEHSGDAGRPSQRKSIGMRQSMHTIAHLPPQLRASTFFDQPAIRQDIDVKEDSAVATLDSILDASANAPVSAFTDHPIAGHVGSEVYGKDKARRSSANLLEGKTNARKSRSSLNLLAKRESSNNLVEASKRSSSKPNLATRSKTNLHRLTGAATTSKEELKSQQDGEGVTGLTDQISPVELEANEALAPAADELGDDLSEGDEGQDDDDEYEEDDDEDGEDEDEDDDEPELLGAPTTLLAELQMRKLQQKSRNRTAATAFPNGMHSTLLELDAVAQVQKESRRHKRVALAWEEPHVHGEGPEVDGDDNVPLGMLFPGGKNNSRMVDQQPLGLMEKREMEDNEPLSRRRERLRDGNPIGHANEPRAKTMYLLEVPGLTDHSNGPSDEDEEETLAQRSRRLKGQTMLGGKSISEDFASELMSHFGKEDEKKTTEQRESPAPEEETLAQRRKRLQAERAAGTREISGGSSGAKQSQALPTTRHSMADLLQAHPVAGNRQSQHLAALASRSGGGADVRASQMYGLGGSNGRPSRALAPAGPYPQFGPGYNAMGPGTNGLSGNYGGNYGTSYGMQQPLANGPGYGGMNGYGGVNMAYGGAMGARDSAMVQMAQQTAELDVKQREMIDRWRQSIMP